MQLEGKTKSNVTVGLLLMDKWVIMDIQIDMLIRFEKYIQIIKYHKFFWYFICIFINYFKLKKYNLHMLICVK